MYNNANKRAGIGGGEQIGRLLTLEEAAERLRISKYTLYGWLQKGENGIREYAFKMGGKNGSSKRRIWRSLSRISDVVVKVHDYIKVTIS